MEAVVGLLVVLLGLGACHGVDTYCDGRQGGAQCYGALGASVTLGLMDDASEISRFDWKKGLSVILQWRNNKITNTLQDRSEFILSNGTFRINNLSRDDGGDYVLEIHNSSGTLTSQRSLHLSVEAPVSSVLLTSECLTSGQTRLSCSSGGGDSPQWSWTLDGRPLTDAELHSGNSETNNITVQQGVSGYLVCTVSNHVSRVCGFVDIKCELSNETQRSEQVFESNHTVCVKPTTAPTTTTTTTVGKEPVPITPCTNQTSNNQTASSDEQLFTKILPIMAGVLSAMVIFLVLGVTVILLQMKKKNNSPREEDDQELTYADVRVVKRQGRQAKQANQRAEDEVEYGQVKFSERPRQTVPAAAAEDECLYSMVRKGR